MTVAAGLWALYGTLLGSLGAAAKWSFTGRLEPHAGFGMYDSLSFRRALVLISEIPLGEDLPSFSCQLRTQDLYLLHPGNILQLVCGNVLRHVATSTELCRLCC